ncbi:hypothetical protein [Crocosphaera sp. XPORK-15E]|uniref:hypothetical protein n=1 Tax=Crocosphaera sp. XPORK-15E TaxID=3110247 RepID=UPI002B1FC349|nr:hypothetical protein [Crocosphaera sp. XPORK-15E]MEA5532885.1 hypothetical protein [Crocosphaera sp. XPORK-15E]
MTHTNLDPTSVAIEPAPLCFTNFATSEQATLFENLKKDQFSGQLHFQDSQGRKSIIYLYLGRIIYQWTIDN